MAMSVLRRSLKSLFGRSWGPLAFQNEGFIPLHADTKIEEETLPDYVASHFYPVRIGEILRDRYQLVGKLGFGGTSTVWLARDLTERKHVAVKLYIQSELIRSQSDAELVIYKRIENDAPLYHPGRTAIRKLLDTFEIQGPKGSHRCLVHPALWESVLDMKHRDPAQRLSAPVVAFILKRLFHALDLLHNECRIVHTDIKEANILLGADDSVLADFEREQLNNPCPRKERPEGTVYQSRQLNMPRAIREPMLCDFGSAVLLDDGVEYREDIQPNIYRAPEIILDIPWTHSVDIWNVGCVAWDVFVGGRLFSGDDPEFGTYRGRAHLAEMIAVLGQPPQALLARANLRSKFFSESGQWTAGIPIPESTPFKVRENARIEGTAEDGEAFLRLMRKMLQWEPEKRSTARELVEDECPFCNGLKAKRALSEASGTPLNPEDGNLPDEGPANCTQPTRMTVDGLHYVRIHEYDMALEHSEALLEWWEKGLFYEELPAYLRQYEVVPEAEHRDHIQGRTRLTEQSQEEQ